MEQKTDVEFVAKVTNDIWVTYFWARLKFSRYNAKNYRICEIGRIQARVFTKQLNWIEFVFE